MQLITESELVQDIARRLQFEHSIDTDIVQETAETIAKENVNVAMYIYTFSDVEYLKLTEKVVQKLRYLYR